MSALYEREIDEDLRREAIDERLAWHRATRCLCDPDLPGRCPGPHSCPHSGVGDDSDDGEGA